MVVGAVIGLLVLGLLGVVGFLQWKFAFCSCDKGKGGKTPGATKGGPSDPDQMDANDLIKAR